MLLRIFLFLGLLFFCASCDKFSFSKEKNTITLDTVVDFTKINVSPSFKACDSIIDKNNKTNCFRTNIHQKIGEELLQYSFTIKDSISEIVFVELLISAKGKIVINTIQSSGNIKNQIPELDSLLRVSVEKLPTISPAYKRGIPVTTKYKLPIKIELKE